jgi:hypothetical protein
MQSIYGGQQCQGLGGGRRTEGGGQGDYRASLLLPYPPAAGTKPMVWVLLTSLPIGQQHRLSQVISTHLNLSQPKSIFSLYSQAAETRLPPTTVKTPSPVPAISFFRIFLPRSQSG